MYDVRLWLWLLLLLLQNGRMAEAEEVNYKYFDQVLQWLDQNCLWRIF